MYWIPYAQLQFQTELSPEEIKRKLNEITEPKKMFRFVLVGSTDRIVYEGTVSEKEFYLVRLTKHRVPLRGKIEPFGKQTYVTVRMRIGTFALLWLGILLLFASVISLTIWSSFENTPVKFTPFLIPICFYSFCLTLNLIFFNIEVNKAKRILTTILLK
ncbi:hypothetical protein QNI19_10365 [Cytophagaceae bacterium DM2B3-1]|uniref:Uncharacterized protein n=1 Tax=Xanthocytophaga flava TaxID=3048013 RepID=A0ABT7CHW7_9BACT|nr:hypothetical protein [Xanthocytophaga flavus]MDJ1493334.1 hypothetical protein [Xanthocytophaga flavus]